MKKIVIVLGILCTSNVFAVGKLVAEGAHKFNQERYHAHVANIGLATHEKMVADIYQVTYMGFGMQDEITGANQDYWIAFKMALNIGLGAFQFEPGFNIKYLTDNGGRMNNDVHVKVSYTLW